MKKQPFIIYILFLLAFISKPSAAATVTIDFESGAYSSRSGSVNVYKEDGFTVATRSPLSSFSQVFEKYGPALAWYEYATVIDVNRGGELFNVNGIDLAAPAFAGVTFESSTGGLLKLGSSSGTKIFPETGWTNLQSFTIRSSSSFDILTQLDNLVVTPVPLPPAALLLVSGLICLPALGRRGSRAAKRDATEIG